MSDGLATLIVGVVMVVGLVGTVVPLMPGLPVLWVGVVAYGFLVGFGWLGSLVVATVSVLVVVSLVAGVVVPKRMTEAHGVGRRSQLAAVGGGVVGFVFLPVVGVLVGAVVGLVAAEYARHRDAAVAWRSAVAAVKGFGVSALLDVALALMVIVIWSSWAVAVLW